ncbi:Alkyl hydroperoxide reductase protein C [Desulfosporosinus sp. BG]|nr:Alkyl hydroperoxide reductase protein C [Desulfosporosinus sp. BG]
MAAVAARYETFQNLGIQVLAISTDSVYSHKIFAETSPSARTVQYPLLSDRTHDITRQYGVLREELGFPFRATFVIGADCKVKYACLYPPEVGRNIAEIIRVIQGLLYEEASGLGVPAYWQPGMQGISKDFKFTGKI